MKRFVRSLLKLTAAEQCAVLEACALAPAAALAARCLAPDRAMRLFKRPLIRGRAGIPPVRLGAIADGVLTAAGARCYTKALVLQQMLARRGVRSDLVLGVASDGPRLHAHAWVELGGHVLIGAGSRTYAPLYRGEAHPRSRA